MHLNVHPLQNIWFIISTCANSYNLSRFNIIKTCSNVFDLIKLEAICILLRKPILRKKKDFDHAVSLFS